jgi:taurine transport system substrate-binding protein
MTSPADVNTDPRPSTPAYKRRRRRIYGSVAVAAAVAVALIIWAVVGFGSSGSGALPKFTISVSQGTVASPDSIIESQPSLAKLIPARLSYVPFDAGVTAIAEMESGSVQAISGVGNPPTTEAIGDNAGVTVVMGWGFDDDQLLVPFASEPAAGAAALSGAIDAAYVYGAPATDLISQKGYHSLVNAEQIAKLGVPGLDVIAVSTKVIKTDPALIQDYVCAELKSSQDMTGPDAATYLSATAKVQGASGAQIVAATKGYPFIPASQQLYWLGSTAYDVSSPIVSAYLQTGKFLVDQGRLTSAPTAAQIAVYIDPSFVKKALAGGCPS